MAERLSHSALTAIAEDIEFFKKWWEHDETVDTTVIRHGSAALRRLLVEDMAGRAWRQLLFTKRPRIEGPDLLAFYAAKCPDLRAVVMAAAGGCRFAGTEFAFFGSYRVDNPRTGVPAMAEEGFAVVTTTTARIAGGSTPSELDPLIHRMWYLDEYLNAPGLIRFGEKLSRREVIKHIANALGGVHLQKNTSSSLRALLVDAEDKLHFTGTTSEPYGRYAVVKQRGELRSYYIETLAIGQAVGRSEDFQKLWFAIRSRRVVTIRKP
jgi:hypothetical protein